MIVTVSRLSGLTKAYRSVLSAPGSLLISGASRWLEALLAPGTAASVRASKPQAAMPERIRLRNTLCSLSTKMSHGRSFGAVDLCANGTSFLRAIRVARKRDNAAASLPAGGLTGDVV